MTDDKVKADPIAWLHTMHMDGGQTAERVTLDDDHGWGAAGRDFDPSYSITSEPLHFLQAELPAEVERLRFENAALDQNLNDHAAELKAALAKLAALGEALEKIKALDTRTDRKRFRGVASSTVFLGKCAQVAARALAALQSKDHQRG